MFDALKERLEGIFKNLRGRGKLTEDDVQLALREIRRALLEADVNYKVVKDLVEKIKARAIGDAVLNSITPAQQVSAIVYEEIARVMGVAGVDQMSQDEYRKAAVEAVRQLSKDVGIPEKLEALKESDLDFLAESAYADACRPGNPKETSVEELKDLFRKLM